MNKKDGIVVLVDVVENEKRHQDYRRVKDLASDYYKLVTGDGVDDLLKRIITRETDEEFNQRKAITEAVTMAILNSTKLPFQKAARKLPVVRKLEYDDESEEKRAKLEKQIHKYWGDKSLEKYLEYAFVDYNYTDPNAFLITEFTAFDPKVKNAEPYPFIATSSEAIMFEYHNEILDYLIVQLPIIYLAKGTPQEGFKYTMYLGPDTIELEQISEEEYNLNEKITDINKAKDGYIEIAKKFYKLTYFEPKNDKIPAIRFGYIRDGVTKGRTFVSVFHHVLSYLNKTMKINSELDQSTAMCAFPQRFAYVTPCKNDGCRNGELLDGKGICPVCNGTGEQPFQKGTQDIITLTLPRKIDEVTNNELVDLEKLLVYKSPPIELLQFQWDYIEGLKKAVHSMMFNADLFTRAEVSVTATEKVLETDNMNDTLYSFARQYSSIWEFTVYDIATFTDIRSGLVAQHKFPNDFKMKSLTELMGDLKAAKDASASTSTISAIEDDINEILYSDRPEELKEIKIKNEINPFRGYKEADIRFIVSQGNVPLFNSTLWENFESIFRDLEMEYQVPWLFDLAFDKIVALVKAKTEEYMKIIKDEKPEEPKIF